MVYKILIKSTALKFLSTLSKTQIVKIDNAISKLSENPRPVGCKKLNSPEDLYRIRVGDYRVIYTIQDMLLIIEITNIGHRKDVYKLN